MAVEHTMERIGPLFNDDRTLFVLARAHEAYYREELARVPAWNTVIQPTNRGTAAALALCLNIIAQRDEDALVAFFPSDHYYSSCSAFRENIETGRLSLEHLHHDWSGWNVYGTASRNRAATHAIFATQLHE